MFVTVHKLRRLPNSIEAGHDWLQGNCASFALWTMEDGGLAPGTNRAKAD